MAADDLRAGSRLLIAEMALDPSQPVISEAAARTVASIRSEIAVKYLADQQRSGRKGSLRALALVRDQAPNLPDVVSRGGRFYAWAANSLRRMFSQPLALTWRFIFAVIGASLARGIHLWLNYDLPLTLLQPARIANSVSSGGIRRLYRRAGAAGRRNPVTAERLLEMAAKGDFRDDPWPRSGHADLGRRRLYVP